MDAQQFFDMNNVDVMELQITAHAISKICLATFLEGIPRYAARKALYEGKIASIDEVLEAGFKPSHRKRRREGIESYYLWIEYQRVKMVAVIERRPYKPMVWITTYTHVIPTEAHATARWVRFPRSGGPSKDRVRKSEDRKQYFERKKAPRRKPKQRRGQRRKDWSGDAQDS